MKRRLQRKAPTLQKMQEACKVKLWVHQKYQEPLKEIEVPFEFVCRETEHTKDGQKMQMWKSDDEGLWRCNVCTRQTKGCTFDPEDKQHQMDFKMCHNRYRDHTMAVAKLVKLDPGWQPLEWGVRHRASDGGYKLAVQEFLEPDVEARQGAPPSICRISLPRY